MMNESARNAVSVDSQTWTRGPTLKLAFRAKGILILKKQHSYHTFPAVLFRAELFLEA